MEDITNIASPEMQLSYGSGWRNLENGGSTAGSSQNLVADPEELEPRHGMSLTELEQQEKTVHILRQSLNSEEKAAFDRLRSCCCRE